MKTLALSFLFLFSAFLVTPTLVCLIKHDADVSYVYSLAEEEKSNSGKENKKGFETLWNFLSGLNDMDVFISLLKNKIDYYYFKSVKPIYFDLLSPPPELA